MSKKKKTPITKKDVERVKDAEKRKPPESRDTGLIERIEGAAKKNKDDPE